MTMLNGSLSLHGVDAERLARSVLEDYLRTRNITLDDFRREDLLQELIVATWQLSESYDPNQDYARDRRRRVGFDGWATYWLRLRVVDWFRKSEGRRKWTFGPNVSDKTKVRIEFREAGGIYENERPKPVLVSLNANDGEDLQLGRPLSSGSLDSDPHSQADVGRLVDRGDSDAAWNHVQEDLVDDGGSESRAA